MLPIRDQIERASYDRWLRRGQAHGRDRDDWHAAENELTFVLNYRTVVEYPLDSSSRLILGNDAAGRCRLCERTARRASFSAPRTVVQGVGETSLVSAEICDECQAECRDPLANHCRDFLKTLSSGADALPILPRQVHLMAVVKSLVTSALLIVPESELAYFTDTLEWVNNPDHAHDAWLVAGLYCHVYQTPLLHDRSWTGLVCRIDDDEPFPYMFYFLAWGGIVLQVPIPLSSRDQDLDGKAVRIPERSLAFGQGPHFRECRSTVLRIGSR